MAQSDFKACCFTGHRPEKHPLLADETSPDMVRLKAALQADIEGRAAEGCETFICGCGKGIDVICGELTLALRERGLPVRLVCVLPYLGFEKSLGEGWTQRCQRLLEAADEVITLSGHYSQWCFHHRNRYMVDHADSVIAVYDGAPKGGTASTVQYALKKGRTVTVYDPGEPMSW